MKKLRIIKALVNFLDLSILVFSIVALLFKDPISKMLNISFSVDEILCAMIFVLLMQIIQMHIFTTEINTSIKQFVDDTLQKISSEMDDGLNYREPHMDFAEFDNVKKLRVYSVTTMNIVSYFEMFKNITAEECILLVRSNIPGVDYSSIVERWRTMVDDHRIKQLTIIGCKNIPDKYVIVLDDKLLLTDTATFASAVPTSQRTSKDPLVVRPRSQTRKEMIKRYIAQFDNYVEHYSDSSDGTILFTNTITPAKNIFDKPENAVEV